MDRMQEKAHKLFNVVKKKHTLRTSNELKDGHVETVKRERPVSSAGVSSCNCCYCPKVFLNQTFLLKHILRRHPGDLVHLHQKLSSVSKSGLDNPASKSLINFLDEEFTFVKKELEDVKHIVTDHAYYRLHGNLKRIDACTNTENYKDSKSSDYTKAKKESLVVECDSTELNKLKQKFYETETEIQNLQRKLDEIYEVVKDDMNSKNEILRKITYSEEIILKKQEAEFLKLRNGLQCELQSIVISNLQEKNMEWKRLYSELQQELERLDLLIELNAKKIDSSDHLQELEKKFERQLLYFMDNTKRLKPKIKMPKQGNGSARPTAHINLAESAETTSKSSKGKQKITDKNFLEVGSSKKSSLNHEFCRDSKEIPYLLNQKLMSLSISPDNLKITSSEFEKKMKLINSEKELLSKKYKNFQQIHDDINSYADHLTLAKLRHKKSRKIRFAESLNCKIPAVQDTKSKMIKNGVSATVHDNKFSSEKKGSTGFIIPDLGGSGDCDFHISRMDFNNEHKQNGIMMECSYKDLNLDCNSSEGQKSHMNLDESLHSNIAILPQNADEFYDEMSIKSLSSWEDEDSEIK